MEKKTIGVFAGSLRKNAFSRAVATLIANMMPANFTMKMIEIGNLPLYNEDLDTEAALPAAWSEFRAALAELDGFLFVTPEYNRSFPAALKNALDVGSRPYGQNLWAGKPGAVVGVSPGKLGAFGAVHHLRQCMSFLDIYLMQQPEAYIGGVDAIVDGKSPESLPFLHEIADSFATWAGRF